MTYSLFRRSLSKISTSTNSNLLLTRLNLINYSAITVTQNNIQNNVRCKSYVASNRMKGGIPKLKSSVTEKTAIERIKEMQKLTPTSLSVQELLSFPQQTNPEERSFIFLRKQLLIRLANIIFEIECLPKAFRQQPSFAQCQEWYWQSFKDILRFEEVDARDITNQQEFTACLQKVVNRHSTVVETMAHAVLEYKHYSNYESPNNNREFRRELTKFLDRFFMSRIGIRLLINQHLALFSSSMDNMESSHQLDTYKVGAFDRCMNVKTVIEDAYYDAQYLCEKNYFDYDCPELELISNNCTNLFGESAFEIGYVPSHLHHICFEVFKNAQRASIENAIKLNKADAEPIKVSITVGETEISIKIEDRGGGASNQTARNWFDYLYTTASDPTKNQESNQDGTTTSIVERAAANNDNQPTNFQVGDAPMAGYGVGLPISRLYARYLSGELQVIPTEGLGTLVVLYLKRNSEQAKEVLPNYVTRLKDVYESSQKNKASTWLGDGDNYFSS